jgi:hypothetical protein
MMAMIDSQQLCDKTKPLGKFGENLRDCLKLSFFQSNWLQNHSNFYQKFSVSSPPLSMRMKTGWQVFIMHLGPTQ